MLFTKAGDVESNPAPTTYTNKHSLALNPKIIWVCDFCHKQQTSIRCNQTHNTHLVHRKCIYILNNDNTMPTRDAPFTHPHNSLQRQAHPTQLPITNKTPYIHSQTTFNQRTKYFVILQININGIRNKIEELKTSYTASNRTSSQYKKQNSHRKLIHQKYTTIRTDREHKPGVGLITLIKGRHKFHKHKHTQGHQHTQHRTTTDQNTHRQDLTHHNSKHILSTKEHDITNIPDSILNTLVLSH